MAEADMPIFTRTFDLLTWLLPVTNHFPRAHRHTLTQRLLMAAFDLRERLEEAQLRKGAARLERLALADDALAFATRQRAERLAEAQIPQPDIADRLPAQRVVQHLGFELCLAAT